MTKGDEGSVGPSHRERQRRDGWGTGAKAGILRYAQNDGNTRSTRQYSFHALNLRFWLVEDHGVEAVCGEEAEVLVEADGGRVGGGDGEGDGLVAD